MCGIAGALNLDGAPADAALLARMIERVRHRGPDGVGVHVDGPVGLAHARLGIIDLAGGAQPMHNEEESVSIVFNGEAFNYRELRADLGKRGHRFRTRSDTEVILRLYEEEGEDCVRYLNGQWALAVWDRRRRTLFLSRDRVGVAPLYYALAGRTFVFGSEIKALFALPRLARAIDLLALDQIFTFWVTLPPRTIFKGVHELPPGHSLTVREGEITVRRHWRLDYGAGAPSAAEAGRSADDYGEALLDLLRDATRIRLRSDVPVGAYLSGGLDSAVVTALVRSLGGAPLKTFSVRFEDPEFDEGAYQQDVVRFLDVDHLEVRCRGEDIARVFPDVIWHTEKPVLRTAPAPLFLLSGLVRENGGKVVLTGEGADEMLGGYDIFKEAKIRRFCAARPDSRRRPLLLRRLYPYMGRLQSQPADYLNAFFQVRPGEAAGEFFSHRPRWELTSTLKALFSAAARSEIGGYDGYAELKGALPPGYRAWDGFCQAQYLEAAYLLPGYILSSQSDRVAMAHAVEGRFPFLDHRVVELAARIPPRLKMRVLDEKHLLRRCTAALVPPSVRRRRKQPYRAPEGSCFFEGARRDYVDELLSPRRIASDGLFDPSTVGKLVAKFRQGRALGIKDNMALVGVLSTQLVADRFIKNSQEDLSHVEHRAGTASVRHG